MTKQSLRKLVLQMSFNKIMKPIFSEDWGLPARSASEGKMDI